MRPQATGTCTTFMAGVPESEKTAVSHYSGPALDSLDIDRFGMSGQIWCSASGGEFVFLVENYRPDFRSVIQACTVHKAASKTIDKQGNAFDRSSVPV